MCKPNPLVVSTAPSPLTVNPLVPLRRQTGQPLD